jgi:DNA-directed RNA polymerase specialized sigma24 family protein
MTTLELEDLSQAVYVRAVAHADRLPPEEPADLPLRRFLARLARSVVVDAMRAIPEDDVCEHASLEANAPTGSEYHQRESEKMLLHRIVSAQLEALLADTATVRCCARARCWRRVTHRFGRHG